MFITEETFSFFNFQFNPEWYLLIKFHVTIEKINVKVLTIIKNSNAYTYEFL